MNDPSNHSKRIVATKEIGAAHNLHPEKAPGLLAQAGNLKVFCGEIPAIDVEEAIAKYRGEYRM